MERKSVIPKISKEVLRKRKQRDPDLPEFQPPSRGKTHSFKEVLEREEEELEK
ncbi:hypothetical protein L6386_06910 [bacterium]|nr:hypothetical protein [bacterium]MBU4310333.1 hypothetical protein [bacterium]MBU4560682.1 hypothetical protein [bacterium]MCG2675913.1 hypothetical protein [bacterium]MCG2678259.1 hypothetical protein [bacterium]